eukprot:12773329-Alexandrium_andersonii.AAC.1
MEAVRNLFQDPVKQPTALAKVIMLSAHKMRAGEDQMRRLADVAKDIRTPEVPAQASASAAGGGGAGVVYLSGSPQGGAPSSAPAAGGGD